MCCRLDGKTCRAMWGVLHSVIDPQLAGRRRSRVLPAMPEPDWFQANVHPGKTARIDGRAVTCRKRGVWVQTKSDLNQYVLVPTNDALVCLVKCFIRVRYQGRYVDMVIVQAYKYAGNKESGLARNAVRSVFCVDIARRLENVLVLPLQALYDTVYLAPVPPLWNDSAPMRRRIWDQHDKDVLYVIPLDDV